METKIINLDGQKIINLEIKNDRNYTILKVIYDKILLRLNKN